MLDAELRRHPSAAMGDISSFYKPAGPIGSLDPDSSLTPFSRFE